MKKRALIFLLLFSALVNHAQVVKIGDKTYNIDSLKKKAVEFWVDTTFETNATLALPDSVFDIKVQTLNDIHPELNAMFPDPYRVYIVTKKGAVKAYQRKFSRFSENYKKYIAAEQGDFGIDYTLLDGKGGIKIENEDDRIRRLYEIPESRIERVDFSVKETCCGVNRFCIIEVLQ